VPVTIGRYRRVLLIAGGALLLAGCPGQVRGESTDDVDRARAATLRAEPILADALGPVRVTPGQVLSEELGWERPQVLAGLYARVGAAPPDASAAGARARMAAMLTGLRERGWSVLWASCNLSRSPSDPAKDSWRWSAYAYRVADGVSYWIGLRADVHPDGHGTIDAVLRAPHHRDPANLFADAPAGLPAGASCIERPVLSEASEQDGAPIELAATRLLPGAKPSVDPGHR